MDTHHAHCFLEKRTQGWERHRRPLAVAVLPHHEAGRVVSVLISWSGSGGAMRSSTEMSQNRARKPARTKLLLPALHLLSAGAASSVKWDCAPVLVVV